MALLNWHGIAGTELHEFRMQTYKWKWISATQPFIITLSYESCILTVSLSSEHSPETARSITWTDIFLFTTVHFLR